MAKQTRESKGTFSDVKLPVARKYLRPISRHPMVLLGVLLVAGAAVYAAVDFFLIDASFLSNGPLSSNHATIEDDCAACHDAFDQVTSEKCSVCHEKHGDRLGVYTWSAHYIYRSNDFQRLVPSKHETTCAACHLEHRGREAPITRVADARCRACHPYQSFNRGHPEFDFAAEDIPDAAALTFPHTLHARELKKHLKVDDLERTCLFCHVAESDGKGFEPITFDGHCDNCHLTTNVETPLLPVSDDGAAPGVRTLEAIRERREPGTQWALFMSPAEFRLRGDEVSKRPLYHKDPWVLENLRLLRRRLFADAGLADLLTASADAAPDELPELYREAIATLESYALGLRSRPEPEVHDELDRIDGLLAELRRSLQDPLTPFDETRFLLALEPREDLTEEEASAIGDVIFDLTSECQRCHFVEDATVVRVQKDQRVLTRAEFDHRAHILELRCLDCHARIPIEDYLELPADTKVDPTVDNAGIQNLPAIAACRQCHTPDLASNSCLTCHYFHPNKSRRSEMLLYLDTGDEGDPS